MTITVELAPEIAQRLQEKAQRSGESLDAVASRVLNETLRDEPQSEKSLEVKPLTLDVPERQREFTPKQIDHEMESEDSPDRLGHIRHESQSANLSHAGRFVVKPIEGMRLPPEWTSGCVQELLDILDGDGA